MQDALVHRSVAEERHRDLTAPAHGRGETGSGGERDAAADDRVGAEHAAREVGDVHRAAATLAEAVLAPVDLGHHAVEVAALRDAVPVAAVGARHVVVFVEIRAHACGYRLLADVHVHEARDLARAELTRHPLFEQSDREHRAVQAEQCLGGDLHGSPWMVGQDGSRGSAATSASSVARNAAAGPPSIARWS